MDIYAWALMPNHFHILCKPKNFPLSAGMRKLLTGYVINFNGRHKRRGHLFQNRYKSIVCQEDIYLKELVRYIHLNLLRRVLVEDLDRLKKIHSLGISCSREKLNDHGGTPNMFYLFS